MIETVLRGVRHMGHQVAGVLPRKRGGGCGIHFDAGSVQFVRVTRGAANGNLCVDAYGSVALEDDMLRGAMIVKPEAVARRLEELWERVGTSAQELRGDTIVLALPAYGFKSQVIDWPTGLPARGLRAWCERRAALLLPGDGDPGLRHRVGFTWADPGKHQLRLYACEADLVDDRVAVLEMTGLGVHAVDSAHDAGRRAFRWAWTGAQASAAAPGRVLTALLQIDVHELDLAVFDGQTCVTDIRERFDSLSGHPEALASVVREWLGRLQVAPKLVYVAAQGGRPGGLEAICDALAEVCGVAVRPFDPLQRFETPNPSRSHRQTFTLRTSLAVPCGLALRAMSMQGVSCE